jgi:hypothetical protein
MPAGSAFAAIFGFAPLPLALAPFTPSKAVLRHLLLPPIAGHDADGYGAVPC